LDLLRFFARLALSTSPLRLRTRSLVKSFALGALLAISSFWLAYVNGGQEARLFGGEAAVLIKRR
jgi:hypothetical protein